MGLLLVKGVLFLAAPVRLSWRNYSAAGGLISRGTFSPILPGECGSSLPFECQSRNGMLAGKLPPCFSRRLLRVPCLVRCPLSSVRPVPGGANQTSDLWERRDRFALCLAVGSW